MREEKDQEAARQLVAEHNELGDQLLAINDLFRAMDAELHYFPEKNFGYVLIHGMKLYFMGDSKKWELAEVGFNEYTTTPKTVIPYDGYEQSLKDDTL